MISKKQIQDIPTSIKDDFLNLKNAEKIIDTLLRIKSTCTCWEEHKSYYLFELIPELQKKSFQKTHLDEQDIIDINYIKDNMPSEMYNVYLTPIFQHIEHIDNEYKSIKKRKELEQRKKELEHLEKERELKKRYSELVKIQHEIEKEVETPTEKISSFVQQTEDFFQLYTLLSNQGIQFDIEEFFLKFKYNIEDYCRKKKNLFKKIIDFKKKISSESYINKRNALSLTNEYCSLIKEIQNEKEFNECFSDFININLKDNILQHNEKWFQITAKKYAEPFYNATGKHFNIQQMKAILNDEEEVLVVAGAGTGKTTTILGKIAYLLIEKKVLPHEILVLVFNKKNQIELQEKIKKLPFTDVEKIQVHTFHSLGYNILGKKTNTNISIKNIFFDYIKNKFDNTKSEMFLLKLFDFITHYSNSMKLFKEFERSKIAKLYQSYIDDLAFETLNSQISRLAKRNESISGEIVKSLPEVIIANFLFENHIRYEYEKSYPLNGSEICKPDFYLPDYDIWIEHWGVEKNEKNQECVPWLDDTQEKDYLRHKQSKLNRYKEDNINLIELFLFQFHNGTLVNNLKAALINYGVKMIPMSDKEKIECLRKLYKAKKLENLAELMEAFIKLFKANAGKSLADLENVKKELLKYSSLKYFTERTKAFMSILSPIYEEYTRQLGESYIDFNDMLNDSYAKLKNEPHKVKAKFIIVDEFQDIATDAFNLIDIIKKNNLSMMYCVGDDWQSIYRFRGSNLEFFQNFISHSKYACEYKIEETFRNGQNLLNIAGNFVMKNPMQKIKKLYSLQKETFIQARIYEDKNSKDFLLVFENLIDDIVERYSTTSNIDILLIARYHKDFYDNFNINSKRWKYISPPPNSENKNHALMDLKHKDMVHFNLQTAHKAKGLESDIVIILNTKDDIKGFPSKLESDYLLEYFLKSKDIYPYEEERRLFYVSLTRAKKELYLLVPHTNQSSFIREIIDDINKKESEKVKSTMYCPKCHAEMIIRTRKDGIAFYGCSNYPQCKWTRSIK